MPRSPKPSSAEVAHRRELLAARRNQLGQEVLVTLGAMFSRHQYPALKRMALADLLDEIALLQDELDAIDQKAATA